VDDVASSSLAERVAEAVSAADAGGRGKRTIRRAKIPKLKKWTPIIVTWADAATEYGPANSDNDFPCPIRRSIGHFIRRDGEKVTIAMEDDRGANLGESDCQTVTSIPEGMIRSVTILVEK